MVWARNAGRIQHQRFLQIVTVCLIAVLAGIIVSGPKTRLLLGVFAISLSPIYWLMFKKNAYNLAVKAFLWLGTFLICGFITINSAIYDPVMICFALVLMYAALFSSKTTFLLLLIFISGYCSLLLSAIVTGLWAVPSPRILWGSVFSINILFLVTGFSTWYLAKDFRSILEELQHENLVARQSQTEIKRLAALDPLTGLLNRTHAEEAFTKLVNYHSKLAVMFIDLDNFKPINDAYGHALGDKVLEILAGRLSHSLQDGEICCRFGGDEFVMVVKLVDADTCIARCNSILKLLASEIRVDQRVFKISASIGMAFLPEHAKDFNELCRLADLAMCASKSAGKNAAYIFKPEWQDEQRHKLELINALRLAISNRELHVVYQPKYAIPSQKMVGVEALVRWHSDSLGTITPAEFIPLAEEAGLIDDIGLFVLEQACSDCKEWISHDQEIIVAVNVSPAQLRSGMLPEQISRILSANGLSPAYLELEITESLLMQDQHTINSQISQLIDQGLHFAIDDFGTGYSNLHYLSRFKSVTLKIDQSFVKQLDRLSINYPLVRGIITLAKTLGLKTVAEGVEQQVTLQTLTELGCDIAQGYYLSKPVNKEQIEKLFI